MSFMTTELMEWTMSETEATRWTQSGHDQVVEPPAGWAVEPPATAASTIGAMPPPAVPSWAAPIGLPVPLAPPLAPPAASDLSATNVAGELTSLPLGWHTLSSEQIGVAGSGFEHIVIGPAGVFTVSTTPHTEGSQFEADRATRLLDQAGLVDIHVQALIMATVNDICRTLLSMPPTLTPLQVQSVYNIAERSETWIERAQPKG
jgi:hypothetical protein